MLVYCTAVQAPPPTKGVRNGSTEAEPVEVSEEVRELFRSMTEALDAAAVIIRHVVEKADRANELFGVELRKSEDWDRLNEECGNNEMHDHLETLCSLLKRFTPGCELP